tara:strand:- start:1338 stop:1895 length:558 start_codon:yes stop_codon:yes gene_type:complete
MIRMYCSLFFLISFVSCKEDTLPKPSSFLRLEYGVVAYKKLNDGHPYSFEYASDAVLIKKRNNWMDISYPKLNATLVLTYFPVKDNIRLLLQDAEKLTFKHMIKADDIQGTPFENPSANVYGKLFEVYGNAATQIQFHATDSVKNFMTGALYFYAKPNYDSILPAVHHIKKDVVKLMETLEWKEE